MDQLATLLAACCSNEDSTRLQNLFSPVDGKNMQTPAALIESFIEQVDQSDFSLSDWVAALLDFDQWLKCKHITIRPTAQMISYIHCCTLSLTDTLPPPDLRRLTNDMLTQYGFDAGREVSSD